MDYYAILGISKTATQDEIKKAYRKLASQYHPDKTGGDTKKFQDIQRAYDILSNTDSKFKYDNQGAGHFQPPPGFGNINDIFNMFNMRNFQHTQQVFNFGIHLNLEEIIHDSVKTLQINTPHGSKFVEINVPMGIDSGQSVRYDNILDNASLQVTFFINEHERFRRSGLNLYSTVNLNVFDMIAGTTFKFISIYGTDLEVTISQQTKQDHQLRISGHGLKSNFGVGDQYILIKPEIPDIISDELLVAIRQEQQKSRKS